jgi:ABC-type sugar transport system substrate-binding protein
MKTVATLVSLLSLMAMSALSSVETKAESSNYLGDLTKGRRLAIYIEGLADPSSGFFRVLNNGAQQAGKDLGVDVKYVYPASVDLASYTEKIEETIAAKPEYSDPWNRRSRRGGDGGQGQGRRSRLQSSAQRQRQAVTQP